MPNTEINKNLHTIHSVITPKTAKETGKSPIPTIVMNLNEQNNNSINTLPPSKQGTLQCLPEMFTDIDLENHNNLNDPYINGDLYKSFIFGKFLVLFYAITLNFHQMIHCIMETFYTCRVNIFYSTSIMSHNSTLSK